jgi:osmotically-inducible protein OsmY
MLGTHRSLTRHGTSCRGASGRTASRAALGKDDPPEPGTRHAGSGADQSDQATLVSVALTAVPIYGLRVTVRRDSVALLEGTVRTENDYRTATRLAYVPGVAKVLNHLSVDPLVGSLPVQPTVLSPELAAQIELNQLHVASGTEVDFNELIGTTDTAEATDEAEPYFPPTDPPIRGAPRNAEGIEVVGGFSGSSLESPIDLEQLPNPLLAGDDEITREVRLALLEDAATADLPIHVSVRRGVVYLRGVVDSLADAEAAEDVASRVPNAVEVHDELQLPEV